MARILARVAFLVSLSVAELGAQRIAPVGIDALHPRERPAPQLLRIEKLQAWTRGERITAFTLVGIVVGAGAGAYVGYQRLQSCDDCFLGREYVLIHAAAGALAGGVLGAVVGAATHKEPPAWKQRIRLLK